MVCGNFLKNSWKLILDCISKLDYLNVIGSRTRRDSELFGDGKKENRDEAIDIANSDIIINHIDQGSIDKIFHLSTNLDPDSILIFI